MEAEQANARCIATLRALLAKARQRAESRELVEDLERALLLVEEACRGKTD